MSSSGTMSVASNCPIFDGTDYPYWKNKMRMHLEAIDKDLWDILDQGIPEATLMTSAEVVKKNWQLDAKARSIICAHLKKAQFNRISGLDTAKKMWMRLSNVNEGVSTQGSTPKVCALKAKARKVSSHEESEADSDDPETLSRELAILTRKFQKFTKK